MTLAHRAVGDIRRGGFRQLRNYVDMCSSLAKRPQQKDFFAYAQKALQRTDSCWTLWTRIGFARSASTWALAG